MTATAVRTVVPNHVVVRTWDDLVDLVELLRAEGYDVNQIGNNQPFNVNVHSPYQVYARYPTHIQCAGCNGYLYWPASTLPTASDACDKCRAAFDRFLASGDIIRLHMGGLSFPADLGITAKVKRWSPETGQLFLYEESLPTPMDRENTEEYLQRHSDEWLLTRDTDGEPVRVVRFWCDEEPPESINISLVARAPRFRVVARRRAPKPSTWCIKTLEFTEIPAAELPVPPRISISFEP